MYLTQGLHRAAAAQPGAIATVFGNRRRSFADIRTRVARLGAALRQAGVQPGDRVAMLSLNSDRYVEYYLAIPWAGAVLNPVNIRWSPAEIAFSLDDCDTRVLIVDDQFAGMVPDLQRHSASLRTAIHAGDGPAPEGMLSFEAMIAGAPPMPDALRRGSDLAGVFYTSGTTGSPKGVMLSHTALGLNAMLLSSEGFLRDGSIGLIAAPLFHVAGSTLMNGLWTVGGRQVILPSFTPAGVLEAIERERVTSTILVPTMIQLVLDHPDLPARDLSSLETLLYAASPISETLLRRALAALPRTEFLQAYGMTELAPIATILPPAFHTPEGLARGKALSAGRATRFAEARVVDADGAELPRGEVGEIAVRSASVMLGYWNREADTARVLRDGWMHTGDAGRMDEDGFVFVVDRVKDMIVTGGENVASVEVENAIARHPAVAACAVIGVPDERWGERVHAVIVPRPGQSPAGQAIQDHCRALIAAYKVPRSIEFTDALPLSGAGKVLKTRLREPHWAGHTRRVA